MISTPRWNIEGHNCCFWVKNADKISQIGYAGAVIASALAMITILGGVLLIVAQQKCGLGSINALAHAIPPSWIYASFFVASTLLLLSTSYMMAITCKSRAQVYTQKEVEEMGLPNTIQEILPPEISRMRYIIFISPPSQDESSGVYHPPVYSILKTDNNERMSLIACKNEEGLTTHISHLHRQGYWQDDEKIWENREKYQLHEMAGLIDSEKLDIACRSLSHLRKGFFNWHEIYVKGWKVNCYLFAYHREDAIEYCILRYDYQPEKKGFEHFKDLVGFKTALRAVENMRYGLINRHLTSHDYAVYNVLVANRTIYGTTYKKDGIDERTEFFLTEKERTDFLYELGFPPKNTIREY